MTLHACFSSSDIRPSGLLQSNPVIGVQRPHLFLRPTPLLNHSRCQIIGRSPPDDLGKPCDDCGSTPTIRTAQDRALQIRRPVER